MNNDWNDDDNDVGRSRVSESKERRGSRPRRALRGSRARRAAHAIMMRPAPSSSRGAASALAGAAPERRRRGSRASPPPSPPGGGGPSSPAFEASARALALRRETAPASVRAAIASDRDEVACALEEERAQRACETREDAAASASTLASLSQLRAVLVEV